MGFVCVAACASRAVALEPDDIALVVNSNEPEGKALAEFYAAQRHIPDNRILVLDLPKTDQITCREYEEQVVPKVKDFLHTGHLESKVKCLVTFYGVPLRIDPRVNTAEETDELQSIRTQLGALPDKIRPAIESIETMVQSLNADYIPEPFGDLEHLLKRQAACFREIDKLVGAITDKAHQADLIQQFLTDCQPLLGDIATLKKTMLYSQTPGAKPVDLNQLDRDKQQYNDYISEAAEYEKKPNDPQARQKLRQLLQAHFGLIQDVKLLRDQADYLDPVDSGAAFDSELAMVEWNVYPHKSSCPNPLNYNAKPSGPWPTLMVTRLDAPDPQTVKAMITTSIKVEQEGLTGRVVIDSLGVQPGKEKPGQAGYGRYDQYLRDLNKLLTETTKLQVSIDEKPEVLPANSFDQVALYVGWYSVHNYIPCCKFNPGAVGYHIASYELTSLRQPGENGWVRGLLNDGVVGSLGPVAEPFLGAFPRPDEFFPLLLSGKLSLAEVYWKTSPTVSWMMDCVGDPLYTPYRKNPQIAEGDLPYHLRQAFRPPVGGQQ